MSVFKDYARYYDLLYRDKDYAGEAEFVNSLIGKYTTDTKSILELGCGTGGHAEYLAKLGYTVHGIDISKDMLQMAESRHAKFSQSLKNKIKFEIGDVRTIACFPRTISTCLIMLVHLEKSGLASLNFLIVISTFFPGSFSCKSEPA